ncbi:MAG: type II CRISPR-associated endonuclease Cas1 [Candidatus Kapabacteria bacterium]|nr:type II CRISPR-associated endonuclease Cas1 [Candidatus Kapabacteria bacterium]
MLKRTISIGSRSHLSTRDEQLIIRREKDDDEVSIPIEDIGLLEIDTMQATSSAALFVKLLENGSTTIFCDQSHHPVGLLIPLSGNSIHALRLRQQVDSSLPSRKRSWQEIIKCKIRNQADVLLELGANDLSVRRRIQKVLSNDSTNQEGVTAAAYWKLMLAPFQTTRDPEGPYPNNVLNYGYAVVRACVARSLVASGLHPALGIKHSNRGNAFALADDLMEPYRPFLDLHLFPKLLEWDSDGGLTPAMKREILQILVVDTYWPEGRRPLLNAIQLSAASMAQVFSGEREVPMFPAICA